MKIFITGVAGFLGSHLADLMIGNGHTVAGNDNMIGGYFDNVPQDVEFHQIDCCDLENLTKAMKGCDIVYHTAATAYEGLSVFSPVLVTKNIFEASVTTITAAIRNNVKRIVYCSSMARYGHHDEVPYKETYECRPQDPYGIAKKAGEDVLRNLCETHGVEYVIAVPHNIVGPRQKYDDPFRNVMSIMLNRMLQGKQPIIYGDGEQKRCFSDIDDCIFCLDKLMMDKKIINQTVNIGPDEEFITINQLFELLSNKLKFNQKPEYYEDRPNEVKHAVCSADKARSILGYETKVSLSESLDKVIDFIKIKGPKKFEYNYELEILNEKTPKSWKEKLF